MRAGIQTPISGSVRVMCRRGCVEGQNPELPQRFYQEIYVYIYMYIHIVCICIYVV